MKRYAGYLFDLDGTLVDTAPDINVALNHALTSRGYPGVAESLTRHWVGHGVRALMSQAIEQQDLPPTELEILVEQFIEHYQNHLADHSAPYPGVVDSLIELQNRGAKLAVVTNKVERFSEPLLAALKLDQYFHVIVCGDSADQPKPAADPALLACERLGVAPHQSLFIGDSDADVGCARAAGCPVVVVRDGYNHGTPADTLGADAVIESFSDLV